MELKILTDEKKTEVLRDILLLTISRVKILILVIKYSQKMRFQNYSE